MDEPHLLFFKEDFSMTKKNILNPNGKSRRIEISESVPFHEERKRFLEHMESVLLKLN